MINSHVTSDKVIACNASRANSIHSDLPIYYIINIKVKKYQLFIIVMNVQLQ